MTRRPSLARRRAALASLASATVLGALAARPRAARAQPLDLDVPFVTTPDNVVLAMLEMGRVQAPDRLLDLGSGDGRIVITAALRLGVRGRGIEIDPNLVVESRDNARKAGVADRVEFVEQDLFLSDLSGADVITMYLLPDVNLKLRPRLLALRPGVRLVSHDWDMGDWQPDQSQEIAAPQKRLGLRKVARLMAWTVPAHVGGRHQGMADGSPAALRIDQRYQLVSGGQVRIGADDYRLATQRIDAGQVVLHGLARDGRPLRLATTLASQSDTIDWQVRIADRPAYALRTQRLPEDPAPSNDPLPSPG